MCEFFLRTITDPALFWPALEAVATFGAALIIIWQLQQLRREAIVHKFDGFKYALELLAESNFREQVKNFDTLLHGGDAFQFINTMPPVVHWILRTLEIVNALIKDGYLDQEFLFRTEGLRLATLAQDIRLVEEGKDMPKFEEQIRLYPNGRDLLRRAEKWREQFEASKR
jgi:hypothetical protein